MRYTLGLLGFYFCEMKEFMRRWIHRSYYTHHFLLTMQEKSVLSFTGREEEKDEAELHLTGKEKDVLQLHLTRKEEDG